MDYRQGKCSSCGAEYKIPASFQHDAAKCKACGGVVAIGPVTTGSPAPAPTAAPVPARPLASAPRPEPAAPKKGGTLERLKAERAAQGEAKPPARPAAPAKPAAARPAPAAKPARQPVGAAAGRSGARRGRGADGGDDAGRGRRGGARRKEKKPNVALLGGALVALLVLGGAGWWFFLRDGGESTAQAAETDVAQGTPAEDAAAAPADAEAAEPAAEGEEAASEAAAEDAGAAPADAAPAAPEKPAAPAAGDPASVDLSQIEDFGPARGTTDEEWTDIQEQVALFLANDGARSSRALIKLEEEYGRKAVPAILNSMKTLDFATEEGRMFGDNLQRTLQNIANGTNFGWKYSTEPKDVYFNKKVVEHWANAWRQVVDDIKAWINLAKLKEKDPDEAARLLELYGEGAAEAPGDVLELDVD